MKLSVFTILLVSITASLPAGVLAQQCGSQAGGALCPGGLCCSRWGYCGDTLPYCSDGCQSQCSQPPPPPAPPGGQGIERVVRSDLYEQMMLDCVDSNGCPSQGFYRYENFIAAANAIFGFGTTGDLDTRRREIAAFLAQTSHETTCGWPTAPDGPYAWGYCFVEEVGATSDYCVPSTRWPCAPGKKYYGRGPIQISYNYNYGMAGEALGVDLLNNPELVATDATISFKTAIWYWMTPQSGKPSCHDVITGRWTPSFYDVLCGRLPGYGVTTNIFNGGLECGHGPDSSVADRIGFYKRYCDIFGVSYGDNVDCYYQKPFDSGRAVE